MDIQLLVKTFFTEDDIKNAFINISKNNENGISDYSQTELIREFYKPFMKICEYINSLQDRINDLSSKNSHPIWFIPSEVSENITEEAEKTLREMMDMLEIDVEQLEHITNEIIETSAVKST